MGHGNTTESQPASQDGSVRMPERISQLDGLRGLAALIVVVFHLLCLLFPAVVPDMTPNPVLLADTPIGILWNGPFAVSIFFVLSGFVIAGAAERRHEMVVMNIFTRYLRLAVPVFVSVMLAWMLLTIFPTAALELGQMFKNPSPWLEYTYQGDIPPLYIAALDGLVANFIRGRSNFNNVLWTMRIELVGSIGIYCIYWLSTGRARIILMTLTGIILLGLLKPPFLAFVLGALLYEAYVRGTMCRIGKLLPYSALLTGIVFGAAGRGAAERWGLPDMPGWLAIGTPTGFIPVISAALIIFAVIALPPVGRFFKIAIFQWLGRISFALYLVHVPILYTLVSASYVQLSLSPIVLIPVYFVFTLFLAHVFTISVDESMLRLLKRVRQFSYRYDRVFAISRVA